MMILEMHDNETPSLMAVVRDLDYDYQAEQWVLDLIADQPKAVLWIAFTDTGEPHRAWKRNGSRPQEILVPPGTAIDPRSLQPRSM